MRWKIELYLGSFPFAVRSRSFTFCGKGFIYYNKFEWRWKKINKKELKINKKELKITSTKPSLIFRILALNQTVYPLIFPSIFTTSKKQTIADILPKI